MLMALPHVFIVKRGTALYSNYEDKFIGIVGVFAKLEDANRAVLLCQREFMQEFGIDEAASAEEFNGFCYEDRGGGGGGGQDDVQPSPTGTPVGLFWEFDDGSSWYLCGVECFHVLGGTAEHVNGSSKP